MTKNSFMLIHQLSTSFWGKYEEFEDEKEIIRIRAIIFVMRESQKGIIIGHKGAGNKRIGTEAIKDLERFSWR